MLHEKPIFRPQKLPKIFQISSRDWDFWKTPVTFEPPKFQDILQFSKQIWKHKFEQLQLTAKAQVGELHHIW